MNRLKRKNAAPAAQGVPAAGINQVTWKERLASYRRDPLSLALRLVVCLAAAITAAVLLALIAYILIRGIPHLKPSLFELHYNSENVSMFPAMVMTLYMTVLCLLIATPLGVGCAIYLTEYAKRGNKVVEVIRLAAETLSGIPSIVYGLFGMLFFVTCFGVEVLHFGRRLHLVHHGAAADHPLHRRSPQISARFLPGSQLWPGRRQAAHGDARRAAAGHARHRGGHHPGGGPYRGRNGGADLHSGHRCRRSPATPWNRPAPCRYTCTPFPARGLHTNEAFATAVVLLVTVLLHERTFQLDRQTDHERGNRTMNKFEISGLDLYYGDFHALKDINLNFGRKKHHRVHRPFGLRQIHPAEDPEPDERPGRRLPNHRKSTSRRPGYLLQ